MAVLLPGFGSNLLLSEDHKYPQPARLAAASGLP